ncbi:hypothetical protein JH06_1516 [Blastocystis sp. subtype 4]|uniref:hypothetical protein n=1 Tax=Blastocystis sp. subtype 4 TaxID=944170 RepID=UPI0007114B6F|nr:hypothetical protein JH06_1516 [Blastocystis sp. subtype 4]KNB44612.1 hypothetical protein JH06_1516 [Blastocystis sp. subtype 4]|eukprot:XP_014528055.1 hypothetical protein JH06_1516 [Blastocystis sp. subtype 4]
MEEEPTALDCPPDGLNPDNAIFKKEEVNPYIQNIQALLESMGVPAYEENVIPFLLENKILAEAKTYAEVAGASYISKVHVSDAAMSLYKRNFAMGRTYTGDKEVTGNVKLRKDDEGVLLPNQANLLDTTDPTVVLSDKK